MRIWAKICGVTRVEDGLAAVAAGADAVGVNFHPQSVRYCDRTVAREIVRAVGAAAVVYGVFVDRSREEIEQVVAETGIGGIQLHGNEAPDLSVGWSIPVIRSVPVRSKEDVAGAMARVAAIRHDTSELRMLFDNATGGGSGRRFDDALIADIDLSTVIVAGGLNPANVADVVARLKPWGVDTAGGVESSPGVKDPALIKEFMDNARSA